MQYKLKTLALLVLLSGLFLVVGSALGGQGGIAIALIMSLVMNVGAYWFSDKIVLAMHGAKPVPAEYSYLKSDLEHLSAKAGTPVPQLYWMADVSPNAFATGRDPKHGTVVVTQGLLDRLNPQEVKGVLAHELGHILNRDTLISAVVAVMASALMHFVHFFAFFGGAGRGGERGGNPILMLVTVILAPLAATLIQLGISRSREYLADETAARLTGDPEALASALQKISGEIQRETEHGEIEPQPGMAHLYIMSPMVGGDGLMSLFSTHPPVKERVKRLRQISEDISGFATKTVLTA
ncbi:MAG TPA: M48 family metalloprotease [Candidatus Omnitrophota bacterium]|nr:M48 family metalloprotease [Candidatus Omnitrophota bacterium]